MTQSSQCGQTEPTVSAIETWMRQPQWSTKRADKDLSITQIVKKICKFAQAIARQSTRETTRWRGMHPAKAVTPAPIILLTCCRLYRNKGNNSVQSKHCERLTVRQLGRNVRS